MAGNMQLCAFGCRNMSRAEEGASRGAAKPRPLRTPLSVACRACWQASWPARARPFSACSARARPFECPVWFVGPSKLKKRLEMIHDVTIDGPPESAAHTPWRIRKKMDPYAGPVPPAPLNALCRPATTAPPPPLNALCRPATTGNP
jgi:hypothetical protein